MGNQHIPSWFTVRRHDGGTHTVAKSPLCYQRSHISATISWFLEESHLGDQLSCF